MLVRHLFEINQNMFPSFLLILVQFEMDVEKKIQNRELRPAGTKHVHSGFEAFSHVGGG